MATISAEVISAAQKTQEMFGIPASLTIAQYIQESGWGNSSLAKNYNNFFGVKAGKSWTGERVSTSTGTYRVYDSMYDSFVDHAKVLKNSGYYNPTGNDVESWINALDGVYAEDPGYASALRKLISQNNLTQYDTGATGTGETSAGSGTLGGISQYLSYIAVFVLLAGFFLIGIILLLKAFDIDLPEVI